MTASDWHLLWRSAWMSIGAQYVVDHGELLRQERQFMQSEGRL